MYPFEVQGDVLRTLVESARDTEWGNKYNLKRSIHIKTSTRMFL